MLTSASYFKNVDSLFSPEYLPSDQDVLHTYMKTARVVDNRLKLGNLDCLITDGGGTHSYRGEWVCLSNAAHCVIFTASLSGYDRCFIEDKLAVNIPLPEVSLLICSHELLTRS